MEEKENLHLRAATPGDVPGLNRMIPRSVRTLSRAVYTDAQIESAIRYVFGVDTQLVRDGTYFVVEADDGIVAGCGGWSFRQTLYGGDQHKADADPLLDPIADAARVRAFFVHPDFARQGVGSRLMQACIDAAHAAGFQRLELMATLPGVPLYERWGFAPAAPVWVTLPDGVPVPFVPMSCAVSTLAARVCTVEDRFLITGRGLVVTTRDGWDGEHPGLQAGDNVEIRCASGERHRAVVKSVERVGRFTPLTDPLPRAWVLGDVSRENVAPGDELWTVAHPQPVSPVA